MKIAQALMECFSAQRTKDELTVLKYALAQEWDDGLGQLLEIDLRVEPRPEPESGPPMIRWHAAAV